MSANDRGDGGGGNDVGRRGRAPSAFDHSRYMSISGYFLVASAAAIIILLTVLMVRSGPISDLPDSAETPQVLIWTIRYFGHAVLMVVGASILGGLGVKLLGAAGRGRMTIIPPEDRELLTPLIESANKEAIRQYVVLSSLSGFTGTFQKIGFSGLPLATVFLTLVFSMLSFYEAAFLELAKLTLGAFIGSFVQKGQESSQLPFSK